MDEFETIVKRYEYENDAKVFSKVLRTAEILLAEDLAPFETEYVLSTLLRKPVDLLQVLSDKRTHREWDSCIREALKLLGQVVTGYPAAEQYYERIVQVCLLHYEPLVRQVALSCLTAVACRSQVGARHFARHVSALEETTTCKAPLAILVGTICEHHPSVVAEEVTRIWRVYLNLLDSNKYTVAVTKAVLQGVYGLFKHFAMDLPTMQLNEFYDNLVSYLDMSRCEEVVLKFLKDYSHLFRERISQDKGVRTLVWRCDSVKARPAILAIYGAVFDTLDIDAIQGILESEIYPRTKSPRFYERFTALRVVTDALKRNKARSDLSDHVDLLALELRLRSGNNDYETCEAVSWCVQSAVPFSARLLQAAILCYDRIPANKRKEVVVHSLLLADREMRTSIVNFLIAESIQPATKEQCKQVWIDIFDNKGTTDNIVMEKSALILQDVIEYVTRAVQMFLEDDVDTQPLPEAIPHLLSLLVSVLRLNAGSDSPCAPLSARALCQCARTHPLVAPAAILCGLYNGLVYEELSLEQCSDEDMLLQCALALVESADDVSGKCAPRDMVTALDIIFSRNDIESSVLIKAVQILNKLSQENGELFDKHADIVPKVMKLWRRTDKKTKYDRILHWDVSMFLGKYGKLNYFDEEPTYNKDNVLMYKLRSILVLDIPHDDGNLKVDLPGILHAAIQREDPSALNSLLTIINNNMSKEKSQILQSALLRVVASLSRCEVAADVIRAAVSLCDGGCANELIRYIEREKSSRSRKMLLEALEEILTNHGESLENVLEYVVTNENDFENQAKTEITEFLLNQLKDNNSMCQKYLHSIIMKVLKSDIPSFDIIKMATDLYVDKIELYQTDDIKNVIHKTFGVINSRKSVNFTKITQTAVKFIKRVLENKNIPGIENTVEDILELFLENIERDKCDVNLIVFLSILKVFEVDKGRLEKMFSGNKMEKISKEIHNIWKKLKSTSDEILQDDFDIFVLLELIREYSEIMATCMRIDCNLLMADLLSKLTPQHVIKFYRKLSKCLPLVDGSCINNSKWFEKQPIKEITDTIEKYSFETRHEEIAQAVKIMMGLSYRCGPSAAPVSMICEAGVKRWARWLSQLHCSGYIARNLESKMAYLFDLADISFDVLTDEEVVALIKEGGEKSVEFLRDFMPAVFNRLVKQPSVLLDTNLTECCTVLGDVVRHAAQRNRKTDVLELVDLLWPLYAERSTMEQKHSLLLDLCPLPPDHGVTRWVVTTISSNDTRLEDKIRLLQVMPSVEEYSNLYKSLSSHLPSRLSELHALSSCCFQALLDALADSSDTSDTLLDIVITLAASDNSKGWWDDALDACMRAVARRADPRVSGAVYARCFDGRSLGVCARLVLPLLRYSTPSFCEEFFSNVLEELVSTLKKKPRDVTAHYSYEKCVLDYVRALYILQVVFQKVPKENIKSPRSVLYSKIQGVGDTQSYIGSTVCKLCVTLRTSVTSPPGADDSMKESCRLFHCANYNCLAAAICCSELKPARCATVFAASVWDRLIGDEEIRLPLRPQWIQRSTRQAVSIEVVGELSLRTSATMSTVRTQPFLRTLSENPLQYDLLQDEEQTQTQDLQLADNALNKHECAGTLTALLSRMSALESVAWRDALVAALEGDARGNVKWLLSQAIVNCKEDLRPHASALQPALLAVIVQTVADKKLNGLHIDIIDTLIFWKDAATEPCHRLNSAIECIITTAIDNRQNKSVYSMLVDKLTKMLEPSVNVSWRCFQKYFEDPKSEYTNCCVDILKRIAKCGVHIPELLPALTDTIEKRRAMSELTALFALALTAARNRGENETEYLKRYLGVLERLRRTDHAEYIELLHAAQKGFPGCCDDTHFRSITDLTPKVVGRAKLKCLDILAAYVTIAPRGERVTSMFDTVELAEMLPAKEALLLAKNGLHLMNEEQRRSAVSRVVGARAQLPARLRADAYGVLLRALRLLLSPEPTEPSAKRRALESNSLLLSLNDEYSTELLAGVAAGVMERDGDISALVREGVGRCLSKDCGVRLCECFLLAVVLPLNNTSKCPDNILAAMLDLFFQPIREQDAFQRAKLRDEPIELRTNVPATSSSRTLTLGNQIRSKQESTATGVNMQINLAEILKSLLLFLEKTPTACVSVITQLIRTYRAKCPGFDFDAIMSDHWKKCLNNVCGVTPWILSVIREVDIWDSCCMEITLEHLLLSTKNAAGEDICKLFLEDYKIRRCGDQLFIMGITPATESTDDDMREVSSTFSLRDLFTCFGKLSNWDDLTAREKSSVKTTLPQLWTGREHFNNAIADYDFTAYDCPTWVLAMWSCYSDSARSTYKWLTDLLDWPRRSFDISALMETTAWDRIRETCDVKPTSLPLHIRPSDCLAEWAFRIMMRSSYLHSLSDSASEEVVKLSHSHQLQWCMRASERGLYEQVLQCCKSVTGLYESETLRWLRQKVLAQRAMALETNDRDGLKSALEIAETYTDQFADMSAREDVLGMNEVMLRLKRELRSINHDEMDDTLQKYAKAQCLKGGSVSGMTETSKLHIHSMCCAAMSFYYYNELWDTGRTYDKRDLMTYMCESLDLYSELCLGTRGRLLVDMVLDRLDDVDRLPRGETKLLNALKLLRHQVDEPSMSQLLSNASKFWIERERLRLFAHEAEMSEHRQRLSLLCDPEYLLLQYCRRLTDAAKNDDDAEWRRVHALMTSAVLDNPHAGPDYMVLQKYKRALTDVAASGSKESKLKVLASIQSELKVTAKNTLFVSHLCPALSTMHELERDGDLARLLCLKPGVYVVKFEEKISVFADSIRRPALVRCRLSDGSVARFIVKCGERARPHCVALRLLATARAALPARVTTGYHVTPLSEDCALIQYLEEHERFRALIRASCDVDGLVSTLHRSKDSELILSPKTSLQQYNQRCAAVPAYLLRSAIESTCVNIQDFIVKRKNFLNSLCSMTLLSYLYGIGDRHLENMMYSIQDGGACHVDCGAILQYGGGELPPARLTRNVLAVCDLTVLEARLQSVLSSLRDSHELLAPAITVSFKWMNDNEAMSKLQYVKGLLQGTTTSHRVTIEVLSKSVNQYRHKYVELLEDVFADFEDKQTYSVEEQVRSLLRQSTEPRVLSVSRSGWEPWL